jgi:hypothetical protein
MRKIKQLLQVITEYTFYLNIHYNTQNDGWHGYTMWKFFESQIQCPPKNISTI